MGLTHFLHVARTLRVQALFPPKDLLLSCLLSLLLEGKRQVYSCPICSSRWKSSLMRCLCWEVMWTEACTHLREVLSLSLFFFCLLLFFCSSIYSFPYSHSFFPLSASTFSFLAGEGMGRWPGLLHSRHWVCHLIFSLVLLLSYIMMVGCCWRPRFGPGSDQSGMTLNIL